MHLGRLGCLQLWQAAVHHGIEVLHSLRIKLEMFHCNAVLVVIAHTTLHAIG